MTDITIKKIERKISLPSYTLGEELLNAISHGVGAMLGVAALTLCLVKSISTQNPYYIISSLVYGISLIILYTTSSLYHSLIPNIAKRILRVLDHCTIYILIAGTYTPFTLLPLRDSVGIYLFVLIWLAAIIGIVVNAIDVERFKVFSMICYLTMGWCVVFTFRPLMENLAVPGLWLLLFGGIAYTLGAILYGLGSKIRYMHSIWHFFVLAGSVLHFLCIYMYVL